MKEFKNPKINIFMFSAGDTVIMASSPIQSGQDGSEGGGGGDGWSLRNQNTEVNIDTITR